MDQDDNDHKTSPPTIEDKLNAMMTFVDQKEYVVIDNGTGLLKCGFSGEDLPRVTIPTVMGVKEIQIEPTQTNDQQGKKYSRVYGKEALLNKNEYDIHFPIQRGIIEDFESMKYCWQHVLTHKNMHHQKKCDILVTDFPLNTKDNKLAIAKGLFEDIRDKVEVDSINIMNSAVLSLFASGRTSGIVVESGQGTTYAVPVFEGYALPHAIQTFNVSGQDVTQSLLDSLVAQGVDVDTNNFEHIREIKEQMCAVAMDYDRAINGPDPLDEETRSYELPDDKGIIQVDHKTRFAATELLFRPDMAGIKGEGVVQCTYDSIQKCDQDLQITLYSNIVVTGGTSLLPGYKERFERDLFDIASDAARTDIKIDIDLPRRYSAWVGGSMISSLSTFENMGINYSEYEDSPDGARDTVLRKIIF